jgi:DNA-directed RNA polymerase specialized sigma24 family protein
MSTHPTLRRLNLEWEELAPRPLPSTWAGEPALAGSGSLGEVLGSVAHRPDQVLAALLRAGDAIAHRLVLQAMLGWAVRAAVRDDRHDLDDYLGELWLRIASYPLDRRPARIAANLVLDTRKRVRARVRSVPVDPDRLTGLPAPRDPDGARAALLLARARRADLIDDLSDRALRLVYTQGLASAEAAAVLGLSPAAMRQRCHRAVRRLAGHAGLLGEVIG